MGKQAASRTIPGNTMKVYARSLLVGLCAAVVVLGVCWSVGLVATHLVYKPSSSQPSPAAPSDDSFTVETVEDIGTVAAPPWYVSALACLALVTASGWQLRRSWRERKEGT
jgi:hypothetical protein